MEEVWEKTAGAQLLLGGVVICVSVVASRAVGDCGGQVGPVVL